MSSTVYPIGYSAPGSLPRIDELMQQSQMLLIDTRYSAKSWNPQWQESTLRERYGDRYRVAGRYLGNVNYKGGPIKLANPERGICGLCQYLGEGYDLILLCQCKEYETCHCKVVVQALQEARSDVQVIQPASMTCHCCDVPVTPETSEVYADVQ